MIINVLLAWMFALRATPPSLTEERTSTYGQPRSVGTPSGIEWPMDVPADWPQEALATVVGDVQGLNWMSADSFRIDPNWEMTKYKIVEIQCGWPMRSLRWRHLLMSRGDENDIVKVSPEFPIPTAAESILGSSTDGFPSRRHLPLEPIWAGFFVNSILFGLFAWLVLRLRHTLRRWLRHRSKQCLECGYPIGIRDRCTECGVMLHANPAVNPVVADRA